MFYYISKGRKSNKWAKEHYTMHYQPTNARALVFHVSGLSFGLGGHDVGQTGSTSGRGPRTPIGHTHPLNYRSKP